VLDNPVDRLERGQATRGERAKRLMGGVETGLYLYCRGWAQFWRQGRLRLSCQSEVDRMEWCKVKTKASPAFLVGTMDLAMQVARFDPVMSGEQDDKMTA
jgi:hypothetical protein